MQIDWWTLGLQTINALVLIWLLSRFLFHPIAAIIAERKAAATELLGEAEAAKAAARAHEEETKSAQAEIAASRAATIRAAAEEANAEREAVLAAARAETERLRVDALAEIERTRKAGRRADAERAGLLAVDIARRLFERMPRESTVAGFMDGLVETVAALPEEARADFCRRGEATLIAPRPLSRDEEAVCRTALARALGHALTLKINVDPSVLAGLELENEHASVRNSFRADLSRIAAELSRPEDDDAR